MSKLLEQVKEIQRKARVCPICGGAAMVEAYPFDWLKPCGECDGKGTIDAPDIDTLVGVIEVLATAAVESKVCRLRCGDEWHEIDCPDLCCQKAALALLTNGLPGDGHV